MLKLLPNNNQLQEFHSTDFPLPVQLDKLLSQIQKIDFHKRANVAAGKPLFNKHYSVISAQEISKVLAANRREITIHNSQLYIYTGEFWDQIDEKVIKVFLRRAAKLLGVNNVDAEYHLFVDNLFRQITSNPSKGNHRKEIDNVLINLKNGTFSISPTSQYLKEFHPGDFLTYQLPFGFDDKATAPIFYEYLKLVLPEKEQQNILAEFAAYVFIKRRVLKLEKALLLYGDGANGKSVFFEVLRAVLGPQNVSIFPLNALTDDKGYHRAKLENKLLNYCSELPKRIQNPSTFKQLASGEPVDARSPCKEPFELNDYAKLMFNANNLPKTDEEEGESFFRRFIIIGFNITIPKDERDPELSSKIIQNELPGVFNWILAGLGRLLNQRKFSYSSAVETADDNFRKESDTVRAFIEKETYVPSLLKTCSLTELYSDYESSCIDLGNRPCAFKIFPTKLRSLGFDTTKKNIGTVVYLEKKAA